MALLTEQEIVRLHRLRLVGARLVRAADRGERTARQVGSGHEFAAHRAYTHGDDLRRVDWNVYGRLNQLVLKLFHAPGRVRVIIALDDAPTMDFGEHNKWRTARRAAAASAIIALGGADRVWLAPFSGRAQAFEGAAEARMLEALETWPAAAGALPSDVLQLLSRGGSDTLLLIVSDLQAMEPVLALLRASLKSGGRSAVLQVHAAEELQPQVHGLARLQPAGHTDLRLRVDDTLLAQYRQEVARYREAAAHAVRNSGAALAELESSPSLEHCLAALTKLGMLDSRRG